MCLILRLNAKVDGIVAKFLASVKYFAVPIALTSFSLPTFASWYLRPSMNLNIFCGTPGSPLLHAPEVEQFAEGNKEIIGRIVYTEEGADGPDTQCTGTMIDTGEGSPNNVMMTAAHCLVKRDPITNECKVKLDSIQFKTGGAPICDNKKKKGFKEEQCATKSPPVEVAALDGAKVNYGTCDALAEPGKDVAFVQLKRPLDRKKFPPALLAPMSSSNPSEKKYLSGYYMGDPKFNERLTTEKCSPTSTQVYDSNDKNSSFNFDCGATHRMSGGPYYTYRNGKMVILGIVVGAEHDKGNTPVEFHPIQTANRAVDSSVAIKVLNQFIADNKASQ